MVSIWPYAEEDRTNCAAQEKRASTDAEYRQDWTSVGTQSTKMPRINNMRVYADADRHKTGTNNKKNELSREEFDRYANERTNGIKRNDTKYKWI
jgi:hypothetical protein